MPDKSKARDVFIRRIKSGCSYLLDREEFKRRLMLPLKRYLEHDAASMTGVSTVSFDPMGINYGYPDKYLETYIRIRSESMAGWEAFFKNHPRQKYFGSVRTGEWFKTSKPYALFFEPFGFRHAMQVFMFDETDSFAGFLHMIKRSDPEYTEEQQRIMEAVAPYMLHAFRKYKWLVNIDFFNVPSVDRMTFGVITTDLNGKITWTSRIAGEILKERHDDIPRQLPPSLLSMLERLKYLNTGDADEPGIFTEMESSSPYGNVLYLALDKSANKYLPVKGRGAAFFIDPQGGFPSTALSRREKQVLSYLARGASDKEIAFILTIGERTVHTYTRSVFKKLNVSNRTEAVVVAVRLGII